eukprot:INCI7265.1.p1 GENE.INCI7265.1~~INCI7265.1.p1  ORF type:complete len:467 (+),score=110.72 INCI7265.1:252-1652(+)
MKLVLALIGAAAVLFGSASAGIKEDRAAALEAHKRRLHRQANFHNEDSEQPAHRGHPGHGGTFMHEVDEETQLEHHALHHHEKGTLPVQHRLPPGMHGMSDHERPAKDQKGSHHNPPEMRHVLPESDRYTFGIDIHTGRKKITIQDIKEHVWDKNDPDHPHAHRRATRHGRRRKFPDHPMRKYDWMHDESYRLSHAHAEALRDGNDQLAEELAANKTALDKELRHLEMMHHGMTEEEYQEFKAWQNELAELNKVDSHAMAKEEKIRHRDRMVELAKNIRDTKEHFSSVSQPHVHPHATLEDNIKMHKLFEAIHKTNDKAERAALKKELEDLRSRIREETKHRKLRPEDVAKIHELRAAIEVAAADDDHLEQEKLRAEIQGIYLSYERAFAEKHGHEFGPRAHDEKDNDPPHLETRDGSKPGTPGSKFNDDPEIIELHEELHHVESHQYEEKQRIENRIKWRMCVQA